MSLLSRLVSCVVHAAELLRRRTLERPMSLLSRLVCRA